MAPISPLTRKKTRPTNQEAEAFERDGETAARAVAGQGKPLKPTSTKAKARRGSNDHPYIKKDGTRTRAVGWHLPVGIADEVRVTAAKRGISQSTLVAEILESWLLSQG